MFGFLKRKTSPLIGLDISSTAVKLIELSQHQGLFRVESFAVVPMAAGAVVDKSVKTPAEVTKSVREVIARSRTGLTDAAFAIPDSSVMTKIIQMDAALNDQELESLIALEAEKYIPYPLDEVSLDFQVIGRSAKDENLVNVLLAASRKENVDMWVNSISAADLRVKIVDVESYAMERACSFMTSSFPDYSEEKNIVIIDVGSTTINLTVLKGRRAIFSREEVFGGEQLTKEIQQYYGLSYEDAGLAKKVGNLPDDYVTQVLEPFKEMVVVQVRRSLQFFFSANQSNEIHYVILAGGTVNVPGFSETIEKHFSVPTMIADPFKEMTVSPKVNREELAKNASSLMIACGLAMRSID